MTIQEEWAQAEALERAARQARIKLLADTLEATGWRLGAAARLLNVPKSRLYRLIRGLSGLRAMYDARKIKHRPPKPLTDKGVGV